MEKKDLVMGEYLPYRFADLEVEQRSQEDKANNSALSPVVRMDALTRIDVIETILELFMAVAQAGHAVEQMTVEQALCLATGKTPQQLNATGVGKAYQKMDGAIGKVVDTTVDGVRTGLNKLGGWLAKVTQEKK